MIHAEQGRDIEACVMGHSPGHGWSDDEAVIRRASTSLVAEAAKLTFDSVFQFFNQGSGWLNIFRIGRRRRLMKKVNGSNQALSDAPFAASVATCLLLEECV